MTQSNQEKFGITIGIILLVIGFSGLVAKALVRHTPEEHIILGTVNVNEGDLVEIQITARDPDGPEDSLTITSNDLPDGAILSATTIVDSNDTYLVCCADFSWTPPESGTYEFMVTVTDSIGNTDNGYIQIIAAEIGEPPELLPLSSN